MQTFGVHHTDQGRILGEGPGGCVPPPSWDDLQLSNTTNMLQKKTSGLLPFLRGATPPKKILVPPLLITRPHRAPLTMHNILIILFLALFQGLVLCKLLAKTAVCSRSSIAEDDTRVVPAWDPNGHGARLLQITTKIRCGVTVQEGQVRNKLWWLLKLCQTTNYDKDKMWGYCPVGAS